VSRRTPDVRLDVRRAAVRTDEVLVVGITRRPLPLCDASLRELAHLHAVAVPRRYLLVARWHVHPVEADDVADRDDQAPVHEWNLVTRMSTTMMTVRQMMKVLTTMASLPVIDLSGYRYSKWAPADLPIRPEQGGKVPSSLGFDWPVDRHEDVIARTITGLD
jgi:hypothetical protein